METPKFDFFFKSSKFEFWLLTKSWNHLRFVNISPTLVIDTSMERSSRVLQHGNIKIWLKKIRNWILNVFFLSSKFNFDLCRRAEIIQVGLNMHPYDDIGDASSSLRGSTSSFFYRTLTRELFAYSFNRNRKKFKCVEIRIELKLSANLLVARIDLLLQKKGTEQPTKQPFFAC